MDIGQFDTRKTAEEGRVVLLRHQYTDEVLGDGGFVVRGYAAPSVQERERELAKAAKAAEKRRKDGSDQDESAAFAEQIHEQQVSQAIRYIVRGHNLNIGDEDVGDDVAMIRRVLNMTFPDLYVAQDENGNPKRRSIKTDKGETIEIPQLELRGKTFAQQVIEAAEDGQAFFGKGASS